MSGVIKVNFKPCFEGWNDKIHNRNGTCCCNCVHQKPLQCHPWNSSELLKGPVSKQIEIDGAPIFVCTAGPTALTTDRKHSCCEMHQLKDQD